MIFELKFSNGETSPFDINPLLTLCQLFSQPPSLSRVNFWMTPCWDTKRTWSLLSKLTLPVHSTEWHLQNNIFNLVIALKGHTLPSLIVGGVNYRIFHSSSICWDFEKIWSPWLLPTRLIWLKEGKRTFFVVLVESF